jgi:hypothetical protein
MGESLFTESRVTHSPQRVVLLTGDECSEVETVLAKYQDAELITVCVYEQARQLAAEHAGQYVAVEWHDGHTWLRLLWCRR